MFYTNHTTDDRVRKGKNAVDILAFVSREGRWGLSACCAWTTSGGLSYWHCPGDKGRGGLVHSNNIFQKITVCLNLYRTLQHVFPKTFESYPESIKFILWRVADPQIFFEIQSNFLAAYWFVSPCSFFFSTVRIKQRRQYIRLHNSLKRYQQICNNTTQ